MHLMYCTSSRSIGTYTPVRQHLPDLRADCVHHLPACAASSGSVVPSVDLSIVEVGQVEDPASAAPAVVGTEPPYRGEQQAGR